MANLTTTIYVHGVPNGHSAWGNPANDAYPNIFYSLDYKIKEQMRIEIRKIDGMYYTSYTYLRAVNVYDCESRGGSYVGLTFNINCFYKDVRNIYNILKTTFEKFIVGVCVDVSANGNIKYRIGDFNSVDSELNKMRLHFIRYIETFSLNSDLVEIQKMRFAPKHAGLYQLNLSDNTNDTILNAMLQNNGKVFLSEEFPSQMAQKYEAEKKAFLEKVNTDANAKIASIKKRLDEEIAQLSQDKVTLNKEIDQYKNKVEIYKGEKNKANEKYESLKSRVNIDNVLLPQKTSFFTRIIQVMVILNTLLLIGFTIWLIWFHNPHQDKNIVEPEPVSEGQVEETDTFGLAAIPDAKGYSIQLPGTSTSLSNLKTDTVSLAKGNKTVEGKSIEWKILGNPNAQIIDVGKAKAVVTPNGGDTVKVVAIFEGTKVTRTFEIKKP